MQIVSTEVEIKIRVLIQIKASIFFVFELYLIFICRILALTFLTLVF